MKRILTPLFGILFATSFAQQEPQFTQYFENTLLQNPAYAGSNKLLSVNTIHREQWVGFEGRPSSTSFQLHSPLKYESVGLGISAVRDVIGPTTQNMVYADFSYTLKLSQNKFLAFGLKGGFTMINNKTSTLTTVDNDPGLAINTLNRINPNVGFGVYYHTDRFFLGVSSPKLMENSIDGSPNNLEKRHFYVHTGTLIPVNRDWNFRPTAQFKSTVGAPISLDASAAMIYKNKLFFGGMYRLKAAVGAFLQYQINDQFRVGMASDFGTTQLRKYNQGTFELLLSYDFNFLKGGIRSPRYF